MGWILGLGSKWDCRGALHWRREWCPHYSRRHNFLYPQLNYTPSSSTTDFIFFFMFVLLNIYWISHSCSWHFLFGWKDNLPAVFQINEWCFYVYILFSFQFSLTGTFLEQKNVLACFGYNKFWFIIAISKHLHYLSEASVAKVTTSCL